MECAHEYVNLQPPEISTATTSPYTAIIPDMTTGMSDCGGEPCQRNKFRNSSQIYFGRNVLHWREALDEVADNGGERTFIMRSGLNVPKPAIPIPAFEVPYAAPIAKE